MAGVGYRGRGVARLDLSRGIGRSGEQSTEWEWWRLKAWCWSAAHVRCSDGPDLRVEYDNSITRPRRRICTKPFRVCLGLHWFKRGTCEANTACLTYLNKVNLSLVTSFLRLLRLRPKQARHVRVEGCMGCNCATAKRLALLYTGRSKSGQWRRYSNLEHKQLLAQAVYLLLPGFP